MAATLAQREKRRAGRPAGTLTAKKADTEGEIMLFGTIGQDWFGEGITSKSFDETLKNLGDVKTIRLRVNSGGGDVFEATAIYNMLVKSEAKVIVEIEGVAASAATLISMAGDEVRISENAHFMIHAASGMAWGNADQLRNYLKLLDNADSLIRTTYAAKTGMDDAELEDMMSFDNWMTAQEALDNGFVDAIDGVKKVKPHVTPDDAITPKHVGALTDDRLAAFSGYLSTLAAAVCPSTKQATGDSPQPVPLSTKESKMNAKLRAKCLAAGMPEGLNGDAADKWLDDNFDKVMAPAKAAATAVADPPPAKPDDNERFLNLLEAREKKKLDNRKSWRKEVDANVSLAFGDSAPAGLKEQCYDLEDEGDARLDGIRAKIQAAKAAEDKKIQDGGVRINFASVQPRDRHKAAIKSGLMVRCLAGGRDSEQLEKALPEKDRAKDYQDFAGMHLVKIAENCLLADGWREDTVRRLSPSQIAQAALGFGSNIGIRNDAGLQTTGSLLEITRDAMNKVLTTAYTEAPQTWRIVGRQGASVPDFKDKHVVKLSGSGNVPIWQDNTIPELAKLSNEKEKYAVEARAQTLSFSWRLLVNDDMDALSRRPQIEGNAMARTNNAVFWAQVTANGLMTDAVALFATATGARKQTNLITGSATPTNTTIGAMRKLLRLMRGLNAPEGTQSDDILNLAPKYIVGPAALEEIILKQVNSPADPASGGNSGVYNTAKSLIPVIEPLLDATSATAWYLWADKASIDTVEMSFLQGQETPFVHEWMDNQTMAQNFTIVQSFAAKAIEWRSMIRHDGV
jgi:ATP-dependent protease ClpP protease subunit